MGAVVVLTSVSLGSPVPEAAGLLMPATAALVQLKTVPAVPLVGVYENSELLHIPGGVSVLVSVGPGLTVTTTFCTFEHPFAVNVYTYVTFTGAAVVLINVSFGSPVPEAAGLLMPPTAARLQLNITPVVPLVGV